MRKPLADRRTRLIVASGHETHLARSKLVCDHTFSVAMDDSGPGQCLRHGNHQHLELKSGDFAATVPGHFVTRRGVLQSTGNWLD